MKFPIISRSLDTKASFQEFLTTYDKAKLKQPLIDFNSILTPYKIYTVNILLALLAIINPDSVTFYDECGHKVEELRVKFVNREFFTRINGVVVWKMLGFEGSKPILIFSKKGLNYGLYFNKRIFVDTKTGIRDYLPSASIILRNWSISNTTTSRAPFSWGSDIVFIDFHEKLLFILETMLTQIPKFLRKHFQGFKYLKTKYKYIISPTTISQEEKRFIENNGFKLAGSIKYSIEFQRFITSPLKQYFQKQNQLYKRII